MTQAPNPNPRQPIQVRVGIPKTGGQLVKAARELGYPVLFSANAFAKVYGATHERAGYFRGFALPDPEQFHGLDAALDSAGFVAAARYGDYRWTVDDYVDLAAAHPWTWWASMDYCCEPEVSGDRLLRLMRIASTAQLLGECNIGADRRGIPRPMPVLQGWHAHEYAQCIEWLPIAPGQWPNLVGLGSVCRRQLEGEHGILNILATVDRLLPANTRLHLFGVKSSALEAIGPHPRIAAMDSMAWDLQARMKRRTGRDMQFRIECMTDWADRQRDIAQAIAASGIEGGKGQLELGLLGALYDRRQLGMSWQRHEEIALEALTRAWCDLLLENAIDYGSAVWGARQDAVIVSAIMKQYPQDPLGDEFLSRVDDEIISGFSAWATALQEGGEEQGDQVNRFDRLRGAA